MTRVRWSVLVVIPTLALACNSKRRAAKPTEPNLDFILRLNATASVDGAYLVVNGVELHGVMGDHRMWGTMPSADLWLSGASIEVVFPSPCKHFSLKARKILGAHDAPLTREMEQQAR